MCVCTGDIHAHVYTYTSTHTHIRASTHPLYTCTPLYTHTHACAYVCAHTHLCTCIHTHARIHINIHPCVHVFHAFCSPACAPLCVANQVVLRGPWDSHSDRHKPCGLCHRLDCAPRPWLPAGRDPTIWEPWGPQGSGAYGVLTGGRTGPNAPGASGPSWPF